MTMATKLRRTPNTKPKPPASFPLRQWTVEQYHELIDKEVLTSDDKVELLDGWIVAKMPQKPEHYSSVTKIDRRFLCVLPTGWCCRSQGPVTLSTSEPGPDIAVVEGESNTFTSRHPSGDEIGMVAEVTRASITRDRVEKARIYAEASIPVYWIVYVSKGMIEVFTDPANGKKWRYRTAKQYGKNDTIPLVLRGKKVADISVRELV
ncbi:MAG: Uma2 family endonuclease [Gemmataceae bacterium]|nr:Uma2 family endonuclease [Gemmataceae bacterium]